jgi:hypothetical protein
LDTARAIRPLKIVNHDDAAAAEAAHDLRASVTHTLPHQCKQGAHRGALSRCALAKPPKARHRMVKRSEEDLVFVAVQHRESFGKHDLTGQDDFGRTG